MAGQGSRVSGGFQQSSGADKAGSAMHARCTGRSARSQSWSLNKLGGYTTSSGGNGVTALDACVG